MRYYQTINLDIGLGGTIASQVFRASSLFDPDYSGVGAQPRGFDQLMTLYDHYVVIGSKITVMATPAGKTTYPVCFGIILSDSQTAPGSNSRDYIENGFCTYGTIATEPKTFVQTYSPAFLGRSKPLSDPDLKGSDSANPLENAFFHVFTFSPNGSDESSFPCTCLLEYEVVLIEPRTPISS